MKLRIITLILGVLSASQAFAADDPCTFKIKNDITLSGAPVEFTLVDADAQKSHWTTNVLPPNGTFIFTLDKKYCFLGVLPNVKFVAEWIDKTDPATPYHGLEYSGSTDEQEVSLSQLRVHGTYNHSVSELKPVPINP
jgi:hypothetical protein